MESLPGQLIEEKLKPVTEEPFSDNKPFNQHQTHNIKERKVHRYVTNHCEASCLSNSTRVSKTHVPRFDTPPYTSTRVVKTHIPCYEHTGYFG